MKEIEVPVCDECGKVNKFAVREDEPPIKWVQVAAGTYFTNEHQRARIIQPVPGVLVYKHYTARCVCGNEYHYSVPGSM